MIYKIIASCLLVALSYTAQSQIIIGLLFGDKLNNEKLKFGLNIGLNYGTVNYFNSDYNKPGLNLGLFLDIRLNDRLTLSPEFYGINETGGLNLPNYSTNDSLLDVAFNDARVQRNLRYMSVPIILKIKLIDEVYFSFGPQLSYLTKAEDIFYKKAEVGNVIYENNIRDDMNSFDFGAIAGLGFTLLDGKGMSFEMRFYQGFGQVSKPSDPAQLSSENQWFQFTASIPIGAKPPEDVKEQ